MTASIHNPAPDAPGLSDSSPVVLSTHGLTKDFKKLRAVDGLDLTVYRGDVFGFLGPNGAGKSTTIKMLAGLLEPDAGRIELDGRDIRQDIDAYKKRIGYIPEQAEVYLHLSGREYLQLVGRLRLLPEKALGEKIDCLLDQLGLAIDKHLPLENYSKGMRQKVLIAAAILHNPGVLLLDEPLTGLDVSTVLIFKEILAAFARQGRIIIFSSHMIDVVERICDRVIIIDRGTILADDSVERLREMTSQPSLESVFKELVQTGDLEQRARNIVEAVAAD
jgi:ABC-2 type transport system ATP-binding protein